MYPSKGGDLQQFAYVFAAGLPELLPNLIRDTTAPKADDH